MPSDLVGTWESVQHDPDTAEAMYKELGRIHEKRFLFNLATNISSFYIIIITKTGVNFILRKAAKFFKAGCEIGHHGDTWSIKTIAPFKDHTIEFKMGVPIKFDSLDGRKVEVKLKPRDEHSFS